MKDLDQKSRSLDQSWSLAPKDHFKIIDLDQFEDQDQDHFSSIIKWEAAGYKSFFSIVYVKQKYILHTHIELWRFWIYLPFEMDILYAC